MDKIVKLKCVSALQECKKHVQRITTALTFLEPLFPVTVDRLNALSDEQTAVVDQFLYRFAKLQDCIGLRLIPTLYALLESDTTAHPFIDILNRLEKLGVLASAEDWQYFRSLRNNFAHEYPERPEDIVLGLNALHASWDRFMALYMQLAEKAEELIGTEDLKCPLSHT
jgi:hypothetical protein